MISTRFIFTVGFTALMAFSAAEVTQKFSNFLDTHIQQIDPGESDANVGEFR